MATAANPYAGFLGDRDPMAVLSATPGRLQELVQQLGAAGLERSWAPGKWSARKVLCHLADCEVAFGYRWRQVVAQPHHVIQTFDQDDWAAGYDSLGAQEALESFSALRRWSLAWLGTLPPAAFSKPLTHPERGELTLRDLLALTAGHDRNHLGQLEQATKASA
jgi:uncharacterized damage-inducible protein DinB